MPLKEKGQREESPKELLHEERPHNVPEEKLIKTFVEINYKRIPDKIYWKLLF